MHDIDTAFSQVGLSVPEIWLPAAGVDLSQWAVIACDQHTSDPGYWARVGQTVGEAPSTLSLIFPEVFLGQPDRERRISAIAGAMADYESRQTIENRGPMAVLVQRTTAHVPIRNGILLAVDLEQYDFSPASTSLIRATEGTILDRLPPRIEIRRQVAFELPHVLVLIDDPDCTVIEPLAANTDQLDQLYDTELMLGGGSVRGYAIRDEARLMALASALAALNSPSRCQERYGRRDAMLLAVGDGNHSLATARQVWQQKKAAGRVVDEATDPARFALVEIINMHDPGLHIEPIHRVVTGITPPALSAALSTASGVQPKPCTADEAVSAVFAAGTSRFALITDGSALLFDLSSTPHRTPAVLVQNTLETLDTDTTLEVDYIHGTQAILELSRQPGHCALLVPAISSDSLFRYVANNGPLPRKVFSLGEAEEKRYYLEARKIV